MRREKAWLERRDISAATVAKAVKVTPSSYSRYENDLSKPNDDDMKRIAEYFGVDPGWLRFGTGEQYAAGPIPKEREDRAATAARATGTRGPRGR